MNYHNNMVYLYAEHSPQDLLRFLKTADGYDQNAAIKFCEQRELTKEKVYLLGKPAVCIAQFVLFRWIFPTYLELNTFWLIWTMSLYYWTGLGLYMGFAALVAALLQKR